MNIHIATIHEIIRPYKCSHCKGVWKKAGSSCNKKYVLNQHISSIHDKKQPHECSICAKEFTKKGSLKRYCYNSWTGQNDTPDLQKCKNINKQNCSAKFFFGKEYLPNLLENW